MLDSLTVVIQMTGLLLLAPDKPNGNGPTHILLPTESTHIAWLSFTADSVESLNRCSIYRAGFCRVRLDRWSLDIGSGGQPVPHPSKVPPSALNLTAGKGRPVARNRLGQNPGAEVRSRVSLLAGEVTDTCILADWKYDDVDTANGEVTVPLANKVEWTIRSIPQDHVPMLLRPLDSLPDHQTRRLPALRAHARDTAHVIITHDPPPLTTHFANVMMRLGREDGAQTGDTSGPGSPSAATDHHWAGEPGAATRRTMQSVPDTATHFHAYYDLLRATERPLPHTPVERGRKCSFTVQGLTAQVKLFYSLDTLTCMVASARTF